MSKVSFPWWLISFCPTGSSCGQNYFKPDFSLRDLPHKCAPASQDTGPPPGMAALGKSGGGRLRALCPFLHILPHAQPHEGVGLFCPLCSGEHLPLNRSFKLLFTKTTYTTQPPAKPPTMTVPPTVVREGPTWESIPDAHHRPFDDFLRLFLPNLHE